MSFYPITAATHNTTPPSSASTSSSATDYTQMFMKLLATELQSQDPTQTMDPTTMVTQMVQINQLNDVAGIYSILKGWGASDPTNNAASAVGSKSSQPLLNAPGGN